MFSLRIPRHACSPRDSARAGDLWRLVQEAAVLDSSRRGWPPARYRELGTAFVVRQLWGLHHREAVYGEDLPTRTWVAETRRALMMRRETRLGPVLSTSVEWVHVGPSGAPLRCPPELDAAFPVEPAPPPELPELAETEDEALPVFTLEPWWTEMDPLAHTNHPRYVDWVDEALSRWLRHTGRDPLAVVPVADHFRFRTAASAGQRVEVALRRRGGGAIGDRYDFEIRADGELSCNGMVIRRMLS